MNPRTPADHGLSGLGLVMQLGGAIFGTLTALMGFSQLIVAADLPGSGSEKMWLFVITCGGIARSAAHRMAGTELLYGEQGREAVKRYILIGFGHTLVLAYYLGGSLHAPNTVVLAMALLCAAWPATLAFAMATSELGRLDGRLAVPHDKGFDGLGCLMAVLGLAGLLYGLVLLMSVVELSKGHRTSFEFQVMFGLMAMLIVRSVLHCRAALRTLTSRDLDLSTEAASRYGNAGVTTALIAGALMFIFVAKSGGNVFASMLMVGGLTGMLLAWPTAVRRFAVERRFAGAGDPAMRGQASTDGGMSSLGWLLLAFGVMGMGSALPAALWDQGFGGKLDAFTMFAAGGKGSKWLPVAAAALQIWAAIELCGAGERARFAAFAYGAVASAITLYTNWALLRHLDVFLREGMGDPSSISALGSLALSLVVPGTTLLLAMRAPPPVTPDVGRVFE